jgi:hypothetical protein
MSRWVVLATAASLFAAPVLAQQSQMADSLLQRGLLEQADAMYYAAVRASPRDPNARLRLGRYLIARGATRVGATLVEEAVQFGLDPASGATVLAPAYLYLGEFQSLSRLPASAIGFGEVARARWLVDHPMRVTAPDSLVTVDFTEIMTGDTLGTIPVRIGGHPFTAVVSARARGISIGDAIGTTLKVRRFDAAGDTIRPGHLGVVDSIVFGRLTIRNYPVRVGLAGGEGGVTIGLDALMPFSPTFDARRGHLELHSSGAFASRGPTATEVATLFTNGMLLMASADGWGTAGVPNIAKLLRGRRWTIDSKHGRILIER